MEYDIEAAQISPIDMFYTDNSQPVDQHSSDGDHGKSTAANHELTASTRE